MKHAEAIGQTPIAPAENSPFHRAAAKPRPHLIYFVLAAFDLFSISMGLIVIDRMSFHVRMVDHGRHTHRTLCDSLQAPVELGHR